RADQRDRRHENREAQQVALTEQQRAGTDRHPRSQQGPAARGERSQHLHRPGSSPRRSAVGGDGDAGHQFTDHVGGGPVGRGAGQQAVRQHRYGQRLDVVGQDVVAAVQGGVGAGGAHQVQGGAGGGAQQQGRGGPGGRDQVQGVALDHGGDVDPADPL